MRFVPVLFVLAAVAQAQGTTPKPAASDYPAQAVAGPFTFAADNLVHSVPTSRGVYLAPDYLVIEVAVYGPVSAKPEFSLGQFYLSVNKGKPYPTTPPSFVIAAIQNPQLEGPQMASEIGLAGGPSVVIGPRPQPRFPGDPTAPPPRKVDVPKPPNRSGQPDEPISIEDLVNRSIFPEGAYGVPKAGVIFFRYSGKMKSIRSVELLYEGPLGSARLKLQ
jgi:hypothetical protein